MFAHLLKRCREMAQIAAPAALAFPQAVEHLLETSLELRDRYAQGGTGANGVRPTVDRTNSPDCAVFGVGGEECNFH